MHRGQTLILPIPNQNRHPHDHLQTRAPGPRESADGGTLQVDQENDGATCQPKQEGAARGVTVEGIGQQLSTQEFCSWWYWHLMKEVVSKRSPPRLQGSKNENTCPDDFSDIFWASLSRKPAFPVARDILEWHGDLSHLPKPPSNNMSKAK